MISSRLDDWGKRLRACLASQPVSEPGGEPLNLYIATDQVSSWEDLAEWRRQCDGLWCFRGQARAEWLLEPSLDRAVRVAYQGGYHHLERNDKQQELMFEFKQQAHLYLQHLPDDTDIGSWLALMQHHGVPTRLLDWTYSPFVAAFFALEDGSVDPDKSSAVWALDLSWLEAKANALIESVGGEAIPPAVSARAAYWNKKLSSADYRVITRVDPPRTDAWMVAEQAFSFQTGSTTIIQPTPH